MKLKPGAGWPIGVAAILAVTIGVNVYVMRLAAADPSVVVEADYYRKAVRWDDEMAQARRNVALGWTLESTLAPVDAEHRAAVHVVVRDAAGRPLDGAVVRVEGFSIARSAQPVATTLASAPGAYRGTLPVGWLGQWELRFVVTRGADRFTAVKRLDAVPAAVDAASAR